MELLKLKVTPVYFKDRVDTLLKYGITHAVNSSCIYETMYFLINVDDKTTEGLIGEKIAEHYNIKDACEDFFLLPDNVKEKAYKNSENNIMRILGNPIRSWFNWSTSPEGGLFWNKWQETIDHILNKDISIDYR